MRIGIPNILPLFGYVFFGTLSIAMTTLFLDKFATATTGAVVFLAVFILVCYIMFVLLSYRFKIVVMTDKELIFIIPFRFKLQSFKFDNIKHLKWDLWETYKMGDYRKLVIQTSSGYLTSISDLEFINYNSLETWLINKTDLKLNLDRKLDIELQQAKWNRWLNVVAIVMFVFFFFLFSKGQLRTDIRFPIQIAIVIIIWRLLARLIQYQQKINES
ncbi:hypothetical protein [Pontibacter pamirensis]|uniref:hypothetical protein n=1 Tax=Pontibacter pamirensis TaxID=2562824 RepID=UPI00138A6BF7|nr:hypothetical protein [Pontibacter pamirensis]